MQKKGVSGINLPNFFKKIKKKKKKKIPLKQKKKKKKKKKKKHTKSGILHFPNKKKGIYTQK
jgi:hypothetical protein